jgi:hypothetical protein
MGSFPTSNQGYRSSKVEMVGAHDFIKSRRELSVPYVALQTFYGKIFFVDFIESFNVI